MSRPFRFISLVEQVSISSVAAVLVMILMVHYIRTAFANIYDDATFAWGPPFHVISLLLFISLALGRKFYLALTVTIGYLVALLYTLHLTIVLAETTYDSSTTFEGYANAALYWLMAIPANLIALSFLVPLLIWEISIVFRVIRQTLKRPKFE